MTRAKQFFNSAPGACHVALRLYFLSKDMIVIDDFGDSTVSVRVCTCI